MNKEIKEIMKLLKANGYQLIQILGVDNLTRNRKGKERYEVIYQLTNIITKPNNKIEISIETEKGKVPSITPIYPSANWYEREIYDLYGIQFYEHPDLRKILTDYGSLGYPFRKDYPITGYIQYRYDEDTKRVISEPIEMSQSPRHLVSNPLQS